MSDKNDSNKIKTFFTTITSTKKISIGLAVLLLLFFIIGMFVNQEEDCDSIM